MPSYWLMKSEPGVYSIDDLRRDKKTCWEGIRNYRARNYMRDMKKGDRVLFYHSNAKPSAVVGLAKVVRESYPDLYALDRSSKYYDPRVAGTAGTAGAAGAAADNPRWFMVDVGFERKFPVPVSLVAIKASPQLEKMVLVNNSRLSVQPVTEREFELVLGMAG